MNKRDLGKTTHSLREWMEMGCIKGRGEARTHPHFSGFGDQGDSQSCKILTGYRRKNCFGKEENKLAFDLLGGR